MPAMTSRTKVCAPKPIATPTTLNPAINGPISTPIAASAISTATAMTTTNRTLRKIGSNVRSCLGQAGRSQQVFDRVPGHADRERQGDDHQNEPETRHGMSYPEHPQQHDTGRQHGVAGAAAETMCRGGGRLLLVRHD